MGNLKGVGRIYQQTFVDTYPKVAHYKLDTSKTPITAADLLSDRVLPFYETQGVKAVNQESYKESQVSGFPLLQ